ncbi:MAG TPA: alpha/beta hydrolase-fold protein [Steroidobacteraceae bacterium]|nr:alpha/beta hydrolase-fold protein [Steroidobacteraceae bacterium]
MAVGHIVRFSRFPSQYVAPHNIDVWLPPGYPAHAPYAALYMFDGQNVFGAGTTWNHQSWQAAATASRLMAWGKTRPFIIVAIWNSPLRMSEYYPQEPWESLTAAQRREQFAKRAWGQQVLPVAPFSDAYLKFVTQELVPAIDRRFAVDWGRDATFIMGSSMGGLMAWYAMARYPRVFGGAACLSTHWPGAALSLTAAENDPAPDAFVRYIRDHFPSPAHHRIYFDHGTRTLDAWYGPTQHRVDRILAAKGWVGGHLESMVFPGADHSERSWSARLALPMTFLLAPPSTAVRRPPEWPRPRGHRARAP